MHDFVAQTSQMYVEYMCLRGDQRSTLVIDIVDSVKEALDTVTLTMHQMVSAAACSAQHCLALHSHFDTSLAAAHRQAVLFMWPCCKCLCILLIMDVSQSDHA